MKRKPILCGVAAACAIALAAGVGVPAALAATKEPIAVNGSEDGCPTTWHYTYKDNRFYSGKSKVAISGSKGICIDVSEHNGKVEWKKVAADGIDYAIIRCGYGQNYTSQDDKQWLRNAQYAKKYGIKIGVYLYSYASNEVGAYGEAKHVLRCLEDAGLTADDVELPVYYDLEEASVRPSNKMLARMTAVFCNTIAAKGYKVGVYSGAYWFMDYLTNAVFDTPGLSKWVANYNRACTYCRNETGYVDKMENYGKYLDMWQFTSRGWSRGTTNGINRVDTNIIFTDSFDKLDGKISIPGNQIAYNLDGGTNSASNPKKFSSSTVTVKLANPTKKNYTFSGWYANGQKVTSISAADYPAVTLTAKWTAKKFNVKYELNGGKNNSANPSSQKLASGALTLKNPTRTGYTFKGWYTSKDFSAASKVTSGIMGKNKETVTVYAKWSAKKYKVSYNPGTKATMPSSYTTTYKITGRSQLPLPTRSGYTFVGWFDNKSLKGTPVFWIEKGSYGAKTYYGKWSKSYQNATVEAESTVVRSSYKDTAAAKATLAKGDSLCVTKTSPDGKWMKVYKLGWVKLADIELVEKASA